MTADLSRRLPILLPAGARTNDPIDAVADNDRVARLRTNSRVNAKMSQQKIEGGNHDRIQ
jgi:hypothetical protein